MRHPIVLLATGWFASIGIVGLVQVPSEGGAFTQEQVALGRVVYEQNCVECHLADLSGTAHGPELAGSEFMGAWGSQTTADLFEKIKTTMPPGGGGAFDDDVYLGLVVYILSANDRARGDAALTADAALVINAIAEAAPEDAVASVRAERVPTELRAAPTKSY